MVDRHGSSRRNDTHVQSESTHELALWVAFVPTIAGLLILPLGAFAASQDLGSLFGLLPVLLLIFFIAGVEWVFVGRPLLALGVFLARFLMLLFFGLWAVFESVEESGTSNSEGLVQVLLFVTVGVVSSFASGVCAARYRARPVDA